MSRRLTTFVLAAFYLLQATWLLHAGMDLLLPQARAAAAARSDSCCTKTCGCPEEAKAASDCCCVKHGPSKASASKQAPRPVSAIEAARCKGVEAAMTQAFTQPVVSGFATIELPLLETTAVSLPELQPHPLYPSDSLDKVPIAQT